MNHLSIHETMVQSSEEIPPRFLVERRTDLHPNERDPARATYPPPPLTRTRHSLTVDAPRTAVLRAAPHHDTRYMFLASVGREYLVLLRDENGIPVTSDVKLSAFKMTPDEQIVFRFCYKPPMQSASLWTDVQQLGVESWAENAMNIGWENPGPIPPDYIHGRILKNGDYAVGDADDKSCALNEIGGQCSKDAYLRLPELAAPVRVDPDFATRPASARETVVAKPQGRTFRGGRFFVVSGSGASQSDYVLTLDGIPTDVEGSALYLRWYSEAASMDYTRWRYGYNWDCSLNTPCAWHSGGYAGWHEGPDPTKFPYGSGQAFENGTRTLTPVM